MAGALQRFEQAVREAGLSFEIRRFPSGTRTAADAARAVGCDIGQIVKSLVFVADGQAFLALTSGGNRADSDRLATIMEATEVRRATADEAREATGFAIGGTPPSAIPDHSRSWSTGISSAMTCCGRPQARPTRCSRSRRSSSWEPRAAP